MEDAAAATTADLAAYASPAKAVLMLDTANADNPDSTITEPADTADPCKKYVDLTISKIWKDFANIDGKRPMKSRSTFISRSLSRMARLVTRPFTKPLS